MKSPVSTQRRGGGGGGRGRKGKGASERESEIKSRKERAAGGGGAVECAEVCMSSDSFQLSQTIDGGKALCMTIVSLTPVKLAGGRTGEDGERGCPHLPQKRECVHLCSVHNLCAKLCHYPHIQNVLMTKYQSCCCCIS